MKNALYILRYVKSTSRAKVTSNSKYKNQVYKPLLNNTYLKASVSQVFSQSVENSVKYKILNFVVTFQKI